MAHVAYVTDAIIAADAVAFEHYVSAVLCGKGSEAYDKGMRRYGGVDALPGAIVGSLRRGLTARADIARAAARFTGCRRATAEAVLDQLAEDNDFRLVTHGQDGRYHLPGKPAARFVPPAS